MSRRTGHRHQRRPADRRGQRPHRAPEPRRRAVPARRNLRCRGRRSPLRPAAFAGHRGRRQHPAVAHQRGQERHAQARKPRLLPHARADQGLDHDAEPRRLQDLRQRRRRHPPGQQPAARAWRLRIEQHSGDRPHRHARCRHPRLGQRAAGRPCRPQREGRHLRQRRGARPHQRPAQRQRLRLGQRALRRPAADVQRQRFGSGRISPPIRLTAPRTGRRRPCRRRRTW